jgi:hypothetical protein
MLPPVGHVHAWKESLSRLREGEHEGVVRELATSPPRLGGTSSSHSPSESSVIPPSLLVAPPLAIRTRRKVLRRAVVTPEIGRLEASRLDPVLPEMRG